MTCEDDGVSASQTLCNGWHSGRCGRRGEHDPLNPRRHDALIVIRSRRGRDSRGGPSLRVVCHPQDPEVGAVGRAAGGAAVRGRRRSGPRWPARPSRPADEALGRPLARPAVLLAHVLCDGGVAPPARGPDVAGDPPAGIGGLDGAGRQSDAKLPSEGAMPKGGEHPALNDLRPSTSPCRGRRTPPGSAATPAWRAIVGGRQVPDSR